MTEVQAAEIDSYCQGNAFFQSAHHGLQGIPAKMGRMGVGGGNDDSAIIRWKLPVMARISGPRRASASAHPLFSYARKRLRRGTGEGVTPAGSATPSPERAPLWTVLEGLLERRSHADDRTVPENSRRCLPPFGMWRIKNGRIPEESPVDAAIGLGLVGVLTGHPAKLLGNEILRVPELPGALVRESSECGIYW